MGTESYEADGACSDWKSGSVPQHENCNSMKLFLLNFQYSGLLYTATVSVHLMWSLRIHSHYFAIPDEKKHNYLFSYLEPREFTKYLLMLQVGTPVTSQLPVSSQSTQCFPSKINNSWRDDYKKPER